MGGTAEEKLKWAFRMYDVDGNGVIDQDEMTKIVHAIYDMLGAGATKPTDSPKRGPKTSFQGWTRMETATSPRKNSYGVVFKTTSSPRCWPPMWSNKIRCHNNFYIFNTSTFRKRIPLRPLSFLIRHRRRQPLSIMT